MTLIDVELAKDQLEELVERIRAGEEIVISRNGKPAARFELPDEEWLGTIWNAHDLSVPDPEFEPEPYDG